MRAALDESMRYAFCRSVTRASARISTYKFPQDDQMIALSNSKIIAVATIINGIKIGGHGTKIFHALVDS